MTAVHHNHEARNVSIKFMYQCEAEKLYFFSSSHFQSFCTYFSVSTKVAEAAESFCQGIFEDCDKIDKYIDEKSKRWSVPRMASLDRCILRLATFELLQTTEPVKVILNEAIELAKIYGTEHSGKFVNGILDSLAKSLRKAKE